MLPGADQRWVRRRRRGERIGAHTLAAVVLLLAGGGADPGPRAETDTSARPARGKVLVASPRLNDPNFMRTVVFVLEYGESGAVGVVVNRSTELPAGAIIQSIPELAERPEKLHLGGPVEPMRLILLLRSSQKLDDAEPLIEGIYATSDLDTLRKLLRSQTGGAEFRLFAGYAGWGAGQLDAEIRRGDWLVGNGTAEIVFAKADRDPWKSLVERWSGRWVRAPERSRPGADAPAAFLLTARADR